MRVSGAEGRGGWGVGVLLDSFRCRIGKALETGGWWGPDNNGNGLPTTKLYTEVVKMVNFP